MDGIAPFLIAAAVSAASTDGASIEVELTSLRNTRGMVHLCLTRSKQHFPNCERDPAAVKQTIATSLKKARFADLPAGLYALSVIHDENANRKLDTFVGIPKEGFGFSRNPVIRFGPPRFDTVSITLSPGFTRTSVRLQYLL